MTQALAGDSARAWQAYTREFLADRPNGTCTLAALAADATRHAGEAAPRLRALQRLSELVGAWVLARVVSHANPRLAQEIRDAGTAWWPC